jgi:hypothetical protein
MTARNIFEPDWEPTLLSEEVVARGTWWYQDIQSYNVELIKLNYNYGSMDLVALMSNGLTNICYDNNGIDYNVSDEGTLYIWKFSKSDDSETDEWSRAFASYFQAREHIKTYAGKYEIEWLAEN